MSDHVFIQKYTRRLVFKYRNAFVSNEGLVVRRVIMANPGLNFNLGVFFFCSKAFPRIIISANFSLFSLEFALKAFISEFKFRVNT